MHNGEKGYFCEMWDLDSSFIAYKCIPNKKYIMIVRTFEVITFKET